MDTSIYCYAGYAVMAVAIGAYILRLFGLSKEGKK